MTSTFSFVEIRPFSAAVSNCEICRGKGYQCVMVGVRLAVSSCSFSICYFRFCFPGCPLSCEFLCCSLYAIFLFCFPVSFCVSPPTSPPACASQLIAHLLAFSQSLLPPDTPACHHLQSSTVLKPARLTIFASSLFLPSW